MARLAKRLSGWFTPGAGTPVRQNEIHAGATFARMTKTQITETARILGLTEDDGGILHVRYVSRLHRASRTLDQGQRTLALLSFLSRFDRVSPREHSGFERPVTPARTVLHP
jgi:hypothetical protein